MVTARLPWALAALCAVALLLATSRAGAYPTIDRPVTDLTGVLDAAASDRIAARLLAARDSAQIAVLLVRTTKPEPIEDYSIHVAEQWHGGDKGKDNGVLVVLALDDHRSRIEVGYGLEGALPDARAKAILDSARDKLRASDYGGAVYDVVDQVIAAVGGPAGASSRAPPPAPAAPAGPADTMFALVFLGFFVGAPLLIVGFMVWIIVRVASRASRPRYYWGPTAQGSWAWIPYVPMSSWSSDSSSGSDFSSSSGGGDFGGGGGGGDFGGGGASSSW